MSKLRVLLMSFGLFLVFGITNGAVSALAQSNPLFVPLGSGAIGALYLPDSVIRNDFENGRWLIRTSS